MADVFSASSRSDEGPMTLSLSSEGPMPHRSAGRLLAVSAVVSFLYCPRLAYITQVFRPRLKATQAQLRGLFLHRVVEAVLMRERSLASLYLGPWSCEGVEAAYVAEGMRAARLALITYSKELEALGLSPEALCAYAGHVLRERFDRWFRRLEAFSERTGLRGEGLAAFFVPERRARVYLRSPEIGLHGAVDLVENRLPVELKTSCICFELHSVQLTLYAMLLEGIQGRRTDRGFLEFPRGERYEVTLSRGLRRRAMEAKEALAELVSQPDAPAQPASCGKVCAAKGLCYKENRLNYRG